VQNNNGTFIYSDEQLMARLKFFIGICLALTLTKKVLKLPNYRYGYALPNLIANSAR
jgi:hypothetical protein